MSVEIKIPTINGLTLNTKNKYVKDDIAITIGIPKYDGSFVNLSEEIIDELPSEYFALNFIESTGDQYIDTGYNMTINSVIDINMAITEYNNSAKMGFFGSYEDSVIYQLYASGTGNQTFFVSFGGTNYTSINAFSLHTLYKINLKADTITINSNAYNFTSNGLSNAQKPLYLFWRNETGTKAKMRLYSCIIYDGLKEVRNFVPCSRVSDNAIGLYDFVENKFYENKGTGTFIGG